MRVLSYCCEVGPYELVKHWRLCLQIAWPKELPRSSSIELACNQQVLGASSYISHRTDRPAHAYKALIGLHTHSHTRARLFCEQTALNFHTTNSLWKECSSEKHTKNTRAAWHKYIYVYINNSTMLSAVHTIKCSWPEYIVLCRLETVPNKTYPVCVFASTHRIFFLRSDGPNFVIFVLFLISPVRRSDFLVHRCDSLSSPIAVARPISIYKRNFVFGLWLNLFRLSAFSDISIAANDTGPVNFCLLFRAYRTISERASLRLAGLSVVAMCEKTTLEPMASV